MSKSSPSPAWNLYDHACKPSVTVEQIIFLGVRQLGLHGQTPDHVRVLPHTNQPDFTGHICDTVLVFEMARYCTAVDRLEAFPAFGIRIKAQSSP